MQTALYVVKRDGRRQVSDESKIKIRLQRLAKMEPVLDSINIDEVLTKTVKGLKHAIKTSQIDELAAENAAYMATDDPQYTDFSSRILISNLHKDTPKTFSEAVEKQYAYIEPRTGRHSPLVSKEFRKLVKANSAIINDMIVHERDYTFDFFGYRTLEKSYLKKIDGKICDRPQYMYMRVALALHDNDFDRVRETYDMMSRKLFIHATPTLFNAGSVNQQLASCFLLQNQAGIYYQHDVIFAYIFYRFYRWFV
jgi:ribonucleotide reductase alpha subunit